MPNTTPTSASTSTPSTTITTPVKINYRLPTDLLPYFYDIEISLKYNNEELGDMFDGTVYIDVDCKKDTNKVILHIKELDIKNDTITITDKSNSSFELKNLKWEHDEEREFMIIHLPESLKQSKNY